ncbi:DUF2019 domain-containing protein [Consotaella aegiceratis]|uniref:DUF2019 domain-containing protein n=1 Tax=Consotaella aegiceratis TaxID=3097961 RepID=UPI002F40FA60
MLDLEAATLDQLLSHFVALGVEQDQAWMTFEQSKVNRAIRQRFAVEAELKSRPGDARRLLINYYEHPNIQVQLNAATATLALFPEEAHRKLEEIRSWGISPFGPDAGLLLSGLEDGSWQPE